MKMHCLFFPVPVCVILVSFSQSSFSEDDKTAVVSAFEKMLEQDDTVLREFPGIAKAHEIWQEKIRETTDAYTAKLETAFRREQPRGDFETTKALQAAVERAKSRHKSPCIVQDRLPGKLANHLSDMNRAKSRANKVFITVVEKEIATLTKEDIKKAEAVNEFLITSFLPKIMHARLSEVKRINNKIFLVVTPISRWKAAHEWSQERSGDLASIANMAEQTALFNHYQAKGYSGPAWIGGARITGRWAWSDGSPFNFSFWAPRQPSGGRKIE